MNDNQDFERENAIEASSEQGVDYSMDFIWGSDQDQYVRSDAQAVSSAQEQEAEAAPGAEG